MKRILLIGGGTGGHIVPLLAVGRELQKTAGEKGVNLNLMVLTDDGTWQNEFESEGIRFKKIFAPKFRRVQGGKINYLSFLAVPVAFVQALWLLFIFMPDLVFSKGSFASLAPSIVSRLYFIPLFIHESDSIPGLVNRFLAGSAKKVFISFEAAARYFPNKNLILSGNPIRESLTQGKKSEAARFFNFNPNVKTILFLAGSQGARFINQLVIDGLVRLTDEFQIIHQTGIKNFDSVKSESDKIISEGVENYGKKIEANYRIFGLLNEEELKNAYAMCDIIISRAGSGIFEISAVGKPAIVIPYPYSSKNHQRENALEFAEFGAVAMEEKNLGLGTLINQISYLLKPEIYSATSEKIKQFAKPDAAKIIAEEILNKYVYR